MNVENTNFGSSKEFIIPGINNRGRGLFLLYWILLIMGANLLVDIFGLNIVVVLVILGSMSVFWYYLRFPANFWPIRICKQGDFLSVNKKTFPLEELLFLSFHETEAYAIIRLEARRKSILFPREAKLLSNCNGFEEALEICREIRDFIDPDLKINHVKLVSGKSKDTGRGSRRITFEHWEFIQ